MKLDRLENKNIVWSLEFCPECDKVKNRLKEKKISFEEMNIEDVMDGDICYPLIVRQLIKQNFTAPVVIIEGKIIDVNSI